MTKEEIRREARRLLRALAPDTRAAAAAEIERRVWTVPEVAGAGTLLLFADLPEEVSTDGMAAEALRRGVRLGYPRTVSGSRTMTLHHVPALDRLLPGRYGIREPDDACAEIPAGEVDAALVPGLAWDRRGARLGRGAGYYDRLFGGPLWRGFRCGIFFSFQEVPAVPTDAWDVPLQAAVTEREVWRAPTTPSGRAAG